MLAITAKFFNYTIVGAGASGLWLAYTMLKNQLLEDKTLCIVESDSKKVNDRTWCYWAEKPISPIEMHSKEWDFIINSSFAENSEKLFPYKYYHIRSNDFYLSMKQALSSCKNVHWIYDEVIETKETETSVQVRTSRDSWNSDRIFSSSFINKINPIQKSKNELWIWQSFHGWRVKTSKVIFNDSHMSMMNFNVFQGNNTQFIYELPFSGTEALVEITRFGVEKITKEEAEKELQKWMKAKNTDFEIIEFESGNIPMTTAFDAQPKKISYNERIIYIGTPSGAIKPTTGYGFKKMQEYAEKICLALKNNNQIPSSLRKSRFRLYDTLLLQILISKPQKGKLIFTTLFKNQPIQRVLKFLDEKTTITEEILIFSKLPIKLFMNSLFTYIIKK
jgi:lycopene beta-cyclase